MGQFQILLLVVCLVGSSLAAVPMPAPLSQSMIDFINGHPEATWKAGKSFEGRSIEHVKGLCGVIENNEVQLPTMTHDIDENEVFPESFDLRDKADMCPTLKEIRDQGSCGSCWAFAAVSTMSDRICLASNGKKQVHLGAEDLLTCCHVCGFGCHGGIPAMAWTYYKLSGIVTGGAYNSSEGCRPYTVPACEHHKVHNATRPPCGNIVSTPWCNKKCISGYEKEYKKDRHYGYFPYFIRKHEDQIKKELINHGSIQAAFQVYEDFANYESGIYNHVSGRWLGGHAVKIIGWGVENNIPYWTVANSWNSDWGENGFFRILRGKNMCGIESHLIAGLPNLN